MDRHSEQTGATSERDYEMATLAKDTDDDSALLGGAITSALPQVVQKLPLKTLLYVLLWYTFSISLSVYNKWMFSQSGLNFPFPVLTTSLHQVVQTVLAAVTLRALGMSTEWVSPVDYVRSVLPTTLASAGDIGMGNLSMRLVTLSFYTMVKSSALGFVLLFSVMFGLEQASVRLALIVGVLTVGVFMMVAGETQFSLFGFILVLSAAASSGLRWALTKLLLEGRFRTKPHPVQTILMISPGMAAILFIWGSIAEGLGKFFSAQLWQDHHVVTTITLLLIPGILAYCMTWSEFQLLHVTGALTLAIAGICKEVATIIVSVIIFQDELTIINVLGVFVTVAAIVAYHQFRLSAAATATELAPPIDTDSRPEDRSASASAAAETSETSTASRTVAEHSTIG